MRSHAGSEKCEKKIIHTTEPMKGSETDNSRYSMSNEKRWEVTKGRDFCESFLRSGDFYFLPPLQQISGGVFSVLEKSKQGKGNGYSEMLK